ncbi:MAG TPA: type II toxin-antitoxin system prevent-host-death family antitoxin [Gammaproteobacteria bacterium]
MTIMTHRPERRAADVESWTVAEAKAKFSELIDRARSQGPQTVTRKGRSAVVVVSVEEWERKTRRTGNLAEFFAASPLRGAKLKVERVRRGLRTTGL